MGYLQEFSVHGRLVDRIDVWLQRLMSNIWRAHWRVPHMVEPPEDFDFFFYLLQITGRPRSDSLAGDLTMLSSVNGQVDSSKCPASKAMGGDNLARLCQDITVKEPHGILHSPLHAVDGLETKNMVWMARHPLS